jgi:hypothetical protein
LIGVFSKKNEEEAIREFFELFKTPWEFYEEGKAYEVVLVTSDLDFEVNAKLIIIYGSEEIPFDRRNCLEWKGSGGPSVIQYKDFFLPI